MTDKEIIKGLECCVDEDCDNCPNRSGIFCIVKIESYALDLINRQQEQLEAAANGQETLQKALDEKDRIIKRLTDEKVQLIKAFGECQAEATREILKNEKKIERVKNELFCIANERDSIADCINEASKGARAEAIIAFAERLKKECLIDRGYEILHEGTIDNLVKEMIGE